MAAFKWAEHHCPDDIEDIFGRIPEKGEGPAYCINEDRGAEIERCAVDGDEPPWRHTEAKFRKIMARAYRVLSKYALNTGAIDHPEIIAMLNILANPDQERPFWEAIADEEEQ